MVPCDQMTWSNPTTNTLAVNQHRITASVSFVASKRLPIVISHHTTDLLQTLPRYCERARETQCQKDTARTTVLLPIPLSLPSLLPSLPSPLLWSTKRNPLSDWLWNKWDKSFHYESCYSLLIIIGRCYYIQWPDCTANLFSSLSFVYLFFDLFI